MMQRRNWIRIALIGLLLILSSVIHAQDNGNTDDDGLAWLVDFLPTADAVPSVPKLLRLGEAPVLAGELLLQENFEDSDIWESFESNDNFVAVNEGRYEIRQTEPDLLLWGQAEGNETNIAVSAQTELLSSEPNSAYGVMCRVSQDTRNQDGYYFFISADGYYTIFRVANSEFRSLVAWTPADIINSGEGAQNHLLAVCADNQLTFYVNGEQLATTTDNALSRGTVSMGAIIYEEDSDVYVAFDNIDVYTVESQATGSDATDETEPNTITLETTDILKGELLFEEDFDDSLTWRDQFDDTDGTNLRIDDGVFRATVLSGEGFLYWSLSPDVYDNAVVEIDTSVIESVGTNEYGIICRADPENSGRGYYLHISTLGEYVLLVSDGVEFVEVIPPTESAAINPMGDNQLTAVCVDNRIALFANGELLFEYSDNKFNGGAIGLVAVGYSDAGDVIDVSFDNLRVYEAEILQD